MGFAQLIDKLDLVLSQYQNLSDLQEKLHKIRKEGNNAIHSDSVNENEVEEIRKVKNEILELMS